MPDQRIQYTEELVGNAHPTKADTINRHANVEHLNTGAHGDITTTKITNTGLTDLSGASAGQIKFPATQNPSADANTFDDYEEGTFTLGVSFGGGVVGITYNKQTGHYTKSGNVVTVSGDMILTSKGSSVGDALLTGLPFVVTSVRTATNLVVAAVAFAGFPQGTPTTGGTTVDLYETTEAGVLTTLTNADFSDGSEIIFGCTYRVA